MPKAKIYAVGSMTGSHAAEMGELLANSWLQGFNEDDSYSKKSFTLDGDMRCS
jgi:hypothetical protein